MFELFTTIVGSHMWNMQRPDFDVDYNTVYLENSRDILLGKKISGKQTQEGIYDTTYFELGHFIHNLIKGNVNFIWAVMSPLVERKHKTALEELKEITAKNLAKNCFFSIDGLAKHNIYHFITGNKNNISDLHEDLELGYINKKQYDKKIKEWKSNSREIDRKSLLYKKKLNVIGRTLKFGVNLLTWGKCLFEKVDIKTEEELWELKNNLNHAFLNSVLPEKPDPEPFEKYLVKWRLYKMKKDELI